MPQHTLLCVSRDPLLLDLRMQILSRFFVVQGVLTLDAARQITAEHFDVILLCHTLDEAECLEWIELARGRWPAAKLLGVSKGRHAWLAGKLDAQVLALDGPEALVREVERMGQPRPA